MFIVTEIFIYLLIATTYYVD